MTEQQKPRRQTIEQERGRQAWTNICAIKAMHDEKLEKEYRALARGFNAMIQINGLGQALGFLNAKSRDKNNFPDKKTAHYHLLTHLTDWMKNENHFKSHNITVMQKTYDGLLQWLLHEKTSLAEYRHATTECLAFGLWLSRFAEAELQSKAPSKAQVEEKTGV
jgi:CRISPR-associated protein Cmr5